MLHRYKEFTWYAYCSMHGAAREKRRCHHDRSHRPYSDLEFRDNRRAPKALARASMSEISGPLRAELSRRWNQFTSMNKGD